MVEEETNQPGEKAFKMLISGSLPAIKKVLAACASISGRASHSLGVVCVSKLTLINRAARSTDYRDSVPSVPSEWFHQGSLWRHQIHFQL